MGWDGMGFSSVFPMGVGGGWGWGVGITSVHPSVRSFVGEVGKGKGKRKAGKKENKTKQKKNSHPKISNDDIAIRIFSPIEDVFRSVGVRV